MVYLLKNQSVTSFFFTNLPLFRDNVINEDKGKRFNSADDCKCKKQSWLGVDLLFFTMWLIYKACKLYRPTKQWIKIKTNSELVSHLSQALSSLFTFSLNSNGLLNVIFSSVCSDYLLWSLLLVFNGMILTTKNVLARKKRVWKSVLIDIVS